MNMDNIWIDVVCWPLSSGNQAADATTTAWHVLRLTDVAHQHLRKHTEEERAGAAISMSATGHMAHAEQACRYIAYTHTLHTESHARHCIKTCAHASVLGVHSLMICITYMLAEQPMPHAKQC
jgi:hypothetical protein